MSKSQSLDVFQQQYDPFDDSSHHRRGPGCLGRSPRADPSGSGHRGRLQAGSQSSAHFVWNAGAATVGSTVKRVP